jgi:hypothetical protein
VDALYKRAIDEGYMGALTISRNNTDALVSIRGLLRMVVCTQRANMKASGEASPLI